MEVPLIKLFQDSDNWKYLDYIQQHQVTNECWTVVQSIKEYIKYDTSNPINWDNFSTWFCTVRHSSFKRETLDIYREFLCSVRDTTTCYTSDAILSALHEREIATKVHELAGSIAEGSGEHDISDIFTVLDTYKPEREEVQTVTQDLDILESFLSTGGLSWRLEELNISCGPINDGDLVLIAARPEVGKTTFLASEASYMVKQLPEDKHVVWFANEESGKRVQFRIIQSVTNRTTAEILSDKAGTMRDFRANGGDRIKLIDNQDLSFAEIKNILKDFNPGLIIYDQLRNVRGYERAGTDVERLKCLYREARSTAQLAPSITVHQARGDGEGELWLHQHQLEGCQTEVQGALDVQIMLGKTHDPSYDENLRGLSVVKNKLTGGARTDASKRHGRFEVYIDPDKGRYYGTEVNPDVL